MVFTTLPNMSEDHELPGIFAKASFCKSHGVASEPAIHEVSSQCYQPQLYINEMGIALAIEIG